MSVRVGEISPYLLKPRTADSASGSEAGHAVPARINLPSYVPDSLT